MLKNMPSPDRYPMGTYVKNFGHMDHMNHMEHEKPKFTPNRKGPKYEWSGRLSSLGYYGDNPTDAAPESDDTSIFDTATNIFNKATPAITAGRKAIQAARGAVGISVQKPKIPNPASNNWIWYGLGAIAVAGGVFLYVNRR